MSKHNQNEAVLRRCVVNDAYLMIDLSFFRLKNFSLALTFLII